MQSALHRPLTHAIKRNIASIETAIESLKAVPGNNPDLSVLRLLRDADIEPSQATEVLGVALREGCATRDVFNAYINVHARHGDVGTVLRGVDEMKTQGLERNTATQEAILEAHSVAGDTRQILSVFAQLKAQGKPDPVLCSAVLVHFARVEWMECAKSTYNRVTGGSGRLEINNVLRYMEEQRIVPTLRAYNALLEMCMRTRNAHELLRFWNDMPSRGVKRNIYSYNMVLEGLRVCAMEGDDTARTKGYREEIVRTARDLQADSSVTLDRGTYTTIFLADKSHPVQPSPIAPILAAFANTSSIKPDIVTYNWLISEYAHAGNFPKISETISKMLAEGISLDRVTYNSLIRVSALHGPDSILRLVMEMKKSNTPIGRKTHQILISSLSRAGGVDIALKLYEKMNVEPTEVCYIELIDALAARGDKGDLERCMALYDDAEKGGFDTVIVRNKLLTHLEKANYAVDYLRYLVRMAKRHKTHFYENTVLKP